jgi:glycosyltransferase involved in cell wall biosynthesis
MVHGGPSQAIRVMERALTAEGIQTETVTTDDDGHGGHLARPLGCFIEEEGARRCYFRRSTRFYSCSWPFAIWIMRHARDYDLIHIHALFSFTSVFAALVARWQGVPYIVRPLGVLNQYGMQQRRPFLKRLSLRLLEGPIIRHAQAVHFTSAAEQHQAESLGYPVRGVVIPLAVQAKSMVSGTNLPPLPQGIAGKRFILFLSRLDPVKNVENLLRGFAEVRKTIQDLHLVIAGGGSGRYVSSLKDSAVRLNIDRHVCWLGHVGAGLKAALLQEAYAFVLPSHSESFGVVLVEALHFGLPCVVSREVALADQIERAGAGISVGTDAASIALGIQHVLAEKSRRVAMSASARALAELEFSPPTMGERLRALYKSVLETRADSSRQANSGSQRP